MTFDPIFFLLLPVVVLSVVVHECAHGLVALWNGDPTARERGRLTLHPLAHLDPVGSLLVPGLLFVLHAPFLIGWAKKVPIDRARLRDPLNGTVRVALAGPASNLLLAILFAGLVAVVPERGRFGVLGEMALAGVVVNCALALFNLLPIPPLDGSWVLMRFLPLRHTIALHHFRLIGLALIVALFSAPAISHAVLGRPIAYAVRTCLGLFGVQHGPPL